MRGIMVQGTGSGVGKSLIVMALCRYFSRKGYRVTPFKAQNMALNSFVTKEGAEIGRAQALQAMAAGTEPTWAMNPVLLKASGSMGSQVILKGRPVGTMRPTQYYSFRQKAWEAVLEGWQTLSEDYEMVIVEGAGSPAEINLRDVEIVNMAIAREFSLPVILVGDIDRGGVFASLYGTMALLEDEARFIKGFLINKFRGSREILEPGLRAIEKRTGVPVLGVVPYMEGFFLEEEDSMNIYRDHFQKRPLLKICVLRLPLISNFTDFLPLLYEDDLEVVFSLRAEDILSADLIIIPGTKNTLRDLEYIKDTGVQDSLKKAIKKTIPVMGICGGYQMMGLWLKDPYSVESEKKEAPGLGLLPLETTFVEEKIVSQVVARQTSALFGAVKTEGDLWGYEIHMGRTEGPGEYLFSARRTAGEEVVQDGRTNGLVGGTYLHGIFENDAFRLALINYLRQKKGLPERRQTLSYEQLRQSTIDRVTDIVINAMDMDLIEDLLSRDN